MLQLGDRMSIMTGNSKWEEKIKRRIKMCLQRIKKNNYFCIEFTGNVVLGKFALLVHLLSEMVFSIFSQGLTERITKWAAERRLVLNASVYRESSPSVSWPEFIYCAIHSLSDYDIKRLTIMIKVCVIPVCSRCLCLLYLSEISFWGLLIFNWASVKFFDVSYCRTFKI